MAPKRTISTDTLLSFSHEPAQGDRTRVREIVCDGDPTIAFTEPKGLAITSIARGNAVGKHVASGYDRSFTTRLSTTKACPAPSFPPGNRTVLSLASTESHGETVGRTT